MKRLHSLTTKEVSLVPNGANRKRFIVLKEDVTTEWVYKDDLTTDERNDLHESSFAVPGERKFPIHDISHARNALARASGSKYDAQVKAAVYRKYPSLKPEKTEKSKLLKALRRIVKAIGGQDDELGQQIGDLSPAAQTAVRAVGRIIAPHADEITDAHLDAVQSEVGIGGTEHDEGDGNMKVKPEHMEAAKAAAEKAYKEHMGKLGYQKYPEGELKMKSGDNAGGSVHDGDEAAEKARKAKMAKENILKEDGSINLEAVPEEMRPVMAVISKSLSDSAASLKAAEAKVTKAEETLATHKAEVRKAEIVRKATEFKHLKTEDVQKTLELADKVSAEEYVRVEKMFAAQDAQLAESGLFSELGSSGSSSDGSLNAWAQIEKAADGIVEKSAGTEKPVSKEQAIAKFLDTEPGRKLYAQHQAARPHGI